MKLFFLIPEITFLYVFFKMWSTMRTRKKLCKTIDEIAHFFLLFFGGFRRVINSHSMKVGPRKET